MAHLSITGHPLGHLFPERRIVSFNHREDRFLFYSMLADLVRPEHVVVDFGAGRGLQSLTGGPHLRALATLKGRCAKLIALDVDDAVLENPFCDEALVMGPDNRLPLPDASVDIIFSHAVLEHVQDPASLVAEVQRVLKPGGWFAAWTPNKWGYVGIAVRLIPNRFHARLLRMVEPNPRDEKDVFPTVYRMNSVSAIKRHFPATAFEHYSFTFNAHPVYYAGKVALAWMWRIVMRLSPPPCRKSLFVFVRRR
jgi:SAM-dependent methyltransferase